MVELHLSRFLFKLRGGNAKPPKIENRKSNMLDEKMDQMFKPKTRKTTVNKKGIILFSINLKNLITLHFSECTILKSS